MEKKKYAVNTTVKVIDPENRFFGFIGQVRDSVNVNGDYMHTVYHRPVTLVRGKSSRLKYLGIYKFEQLETYVNGKTTKP